MEPPAEVVAYDESWPVAFAALAGRLHGVLPAGARVEHVGSTAVPGLAAKPILDVDIVVPSAASVGPVVAALASLGYVHRGDLGIAGREAFHAPPGGRYHHLYVVVDGSPPYRDHVDLRDHLRRDASARRRYAEEKHRLAPLLRTDREAYVEQKGVIVQALLREARAPLGKD